MKIAKRALTYSASRQYLSLVVPDIVLGSEEMIDVPDDWLNVNKRQCIITLTRKGYEANKESLKKAFEASTDNRGHSWIEFEEYVEKQLTRGY